MKGLYGAMIATVYDKYFKLLLSFGSKASLY